MGTYAGAGCVRVSGHRPGRREERRSREFSYKGKKEIRRLLQAISDSGTMLVEQGPSRVVSEIRQVIIVSPDDPGLYGNFEEDLSDRDIVGWFVGAEPDFVWNYCPVKQIAEILPTIIRARQPETKIVVCLQEHIFNQVAFQIERALFKESLNCLILVRFGAFPIEVVSIYGEKQQSVQMWLNFGPEGYKRANRRRPEEVIPRPNPKLSFCY